MPYLLLLGSRECEKALWGLILNQELKQFEGLEFPSQIKVAVKSIPV